LADGSTKLDLARNAVGLVLQRETIGDNLAFRLFGGSCSDSGTYLTPTIPFAADNAERISKEMRGLRTEGEATLFSTIFHAVRDLREVTRSGGQNRRIIVIAGNPDACGDDITAVQRLIAPAHNGGGSGGASIRLDLDFVGIGLGDREKREFDSYAEKTGGAAHFVDDLRQLKQHLFENIEAVRVLRVAKRLSSLLKDSVESLSPVIVNIKKGDSAAAERDLQRASDQFYSSEVPFKELGDRITRGELTPSLRENAQIVFEVAKKSRDLQSQVLMLVQAMLTLSQDELALKGATDEYEKLRENYNKSDEHLQDLVGQLENKAP